MQERRPTQKPIKTWDKIANANEKENAIIKNLFLNDFSKNNKEKGMKKSEKK